MKEISLTQNKIAIIDDEDYDRVNQYKWHAYKSGRSYYAKRTDNDNKTCESMHRFILNASKDIEVDHEDHDGLNNQRYNLRIATHQQNIHHQLKQTRPTSSKYKGASWHKKTQKWQASIQINGKQKYLGLFESETKAALAYDQAALIYHGKFAKLN